LIFSSAPVTAQLPHLDIQQLTCRSTTTTRKTSATSSGLMARTAYTTSLMGDLQRQQPAQQGAIFHAGFKPNKAKQDTCGNDTLWQPPRSNIEIHVRHRPQLQQLCTHVSTGGSTMISSKQGMRQRYSVAATVRPQFDAFALMSPQVAA
jgi:hypothetical protein